MTTPPPATAFTYDVEVHAHGRVELTLPFAAGRRVMIIVIPEPVESFRELAAAATSSLAFWDNPFDDEDWNGDPTG